MMLARDRLRISSQLFFEEFAGDAGFLEQSESDSARLLTVLALVTLKATGKPVAFEDSRVFRRRE